MQERNVLRVNASEEEAQYRDAVSQILLDIQREERVTLRAIAETIDVSTRTIGAASNCETTLNVFFLKRLGQAYGAHYLTPFARLSGGRVLSEHVEDGPDLLPMLAEVMHLITAARLPGKNETLKQQLDYLPAIKKLARACEASTAIIEKRRTDACAR